MVFERRTFVEEFCQAREFKHDFSRKEMIKLLLKYGLDPNFKTEDGKDLMHLLDDNVVEPDKDGAEIPPHCPNFIRLRSSF